MTPLAVSSQRWERLVQANEPQLRQLALKSPPSSGALYWSLGRFVAADASVLGNDGVEGGYKWNANSRIAFFGGLYPEHRGNRSLKIAEEDRQVGAYGVYEIWGVLVRAILTPLRAL